LVAIVLEIIWYRRRLSDELAEAKQRYEKKLEKLQAETAGKPANA